MAESGTICKMKLPRDYLARIPCPKEPQCCPHPQSLQESARRGIELTNNFTPKLMSRPVAQLGQASRSVAGGIRQHRQPIHVEPRSRRTHSFSGPRVSTCHGHQQLIRTEAPGSYKNLWKNVRARHRYGDPESTCPLLSSCSPGFALVELSSST